MPLSPSATRELLAKLGHHPKRFLGQNFLVDGNIVRKSLELACIAPGDTVVEIGPGLGTLTSALLRAGATVWAVEKDRALHAHLADSLAREFPDTFHLLEGDAVEHPLAGLPSGEVTSDKYQVARTAATVGLDLASGRADAAAPTVLDAPHPSERQLEQSFAGMAGRAIEPIIKPLGFDWRIGIGIIGSLAAREVFISTMGTVFSIENADEEPETLRDAFARAAWPDGRPLFTPLVCVTLLVFYVFAMQCLATLAVVRRETNSLRWPAFQLAYMTGTAWIVCLLIHQGGRLLGF